MRKISALIIAVTLLLSNFTNPIQVFAGNQDVKLKTAEEMIEPKKLPEWAKWLADFAWFVAGKISPYTYNIDADTVATANQITITTKSIHYNSGNYGGQSNTAITVDSSKGSLNVDVSFLPTCDPISFASGKKMF